jgi:small subunit ribosomal protein S4e
LGRKSGPKQLKRMASPSYWPIHRKEFKWVAKPVPGPHKIEECLPLLLALRDALRYANTQREAAIILAERKVKVDGKIVVDGKFPVGLMDVIEIPDLAIAFRVLPSPKKGLILHPINGDETTFKLCKIENKTNIKKGMIQLNLHDGRNLIIPVKDPKKPEEDIYKTSDTIKLSIPKQEILAHLKFEEGLFAVVTRGKNAGQYGKILTIQIGVGSLPNFVTLESREGTHMQTLLNYIFALGKEDSWISLPEANK